MCSFDLARALVVRGRCRPGLNLPNQAGHARMIAERRRRLRVGVLRVDLGAHTEQERDLIFLRLGLLHPGPPAGFARAQAAAIDLDDGHRRRFGHARLQLPPPLLGGLRVPHLGQAGADLLGKALDVAAADVHVADRVRGGGRTGGGRQLAGEGDQATEQVRGVAVTGQAQAGPQREKNPGGRPGSSRPVPRR